MCPQGIWSSELKQQHPVLFQEYPHIINTVRKNCGLNEHIMTEDQLEANQESRVDYNKRTFGFVFGKDEASTVRSKILVRLPQFGHFLRFSEKLSDNFKNDQISEPDQIF